MPTHASSDIGLTFIDVVADHVGSIISATPMKVARVVLARLLRDMATLSPKLARNRVRERVLIATFLGLFILRLFSCFGPFLLVLSPSAFISSPPWDEAPFGVVAQSSSFNG